MKCFSKPAVERAVKDRKEGYLEEVIKRNTSTSPFQYCLSQEDIIYLKENFHKEVFPSIVEMAKNLSKSAIEEATAIAKQEPPATQEEIDARLEICRICEFYTPNIPELSEEKRKQNRCVKCGCFMNFKTKLRSAHCPVGKW